MEDQPDDVMSDDDDLMFALGQEVRGFFDEQLATLNARLDLQEQILVALKELQLALTAPRVIVTDSNNKPVGIKILA
jgi:hypothetical protein